MLTGMTMHQRKHVLLLSLPFAETSIPSIQLALLEAYFKERDIKTKSQHLYLKAAEMYGLHNYNYLINSPNDSYIAQLGFSKYVFLNHWENNIKKFRYFYEELIAHDDQFLQALPFNTYLQQTDKFYSYATHPSIWKKYDIIGFTLNYGQLLPSLAISKKIKEDDPTKTIVFGGSTTINELGIQMLKTFDWIDFIVSGEGEEPLFLLANDFEHYTSIPGLIYRNNHKPIWNKNNTYLDLDMLPYPDFQSYFNDLNLITNDIQQYYSLYGRLPIEFSRGCWWNNCTFCNLRAYNKKYREKHINRFTEELDFLSEHYKTLTFQVISNTLPQQNYQELCNKIITLNKDFTLYIEARAGRLKSNDYTLLKQAGFRHIQTGIEAFSTNLLKKMNKGATVIDNIAALKYCKENHITNHYNMIINYPNEEPQDYTETQHNIQLFKQYLDPPQISKFVVGYQSPIYNNQTQYNIQQLEYKIIDTLLYPPDILKNNFCFFYDFERKKTLKEKNWEELIHNWKQEHQQRQTEALQRNTTINQLIFYYLDGNTYLQIYDKRTHNVLIYTLNPTERDIFLSCVDVTSYKTLRTQHPHIPENTLKNTLKIFEQTGIFFRENNRYLALPLNYKKIYGKTDSPKKEPELHVSEVS